MDIKPPFAYQEVIPLTKTHRVVLPAEGNLPPVFRSAMVLPISYSEFTLACRDYPVVFISGDEGKSMVAMAVLGIEQQQNLFVGADQKWDRNTYVPAYVRRYPFCMSRVNVSGKEAPERIACVEKRAISARGDALYDDKGEPLPAWEKMRKLLFEYEADLARTEEMCRVVKDLGLLEPFVMQAQPNTGQPLSVAGMQRVNEQKLAELAGDKLAELVKNGVLARIYAHLISMANFGRLLDRRATRGAAPK